MIVTFKIQVPYVQRFEKCATKRVFGYSTLFSVTVELLNYFFAFR